MTRASSGFWDTLGHRAMARPAWSWALAMLVMVPLAILGARTEFLQDTLSEMPADDRVGRQPPVHRDEVGPGADLAR